MDDKDFVSLVESLDQCWMQGRLQDLGVFLADDVVFVAPGGQARSEGALAAVESYRQFLAHARINHYRASDFAVTQRGDTAVVEYAWQIGWTTAGEDHTETGRDILVLLHRKENWRVAWRTQIPSASK